MIESSESTRKPPNLERLFQDTKEDLLRYFSRRHADPEQSRDLVQETFVELARMSGKDTAPKSWRAYLFGVARHLSLAAWKRDYRERDAKDDLSAKTAGAPASPPDDERVTMAHEVMASLPPLQREILDLRFSQDLSYLEISQVLKIPVGTVRSRLHHAVAAVRDRIDEIN